MTMQAFDEETALLRAFEDVPEHLVAEIIDGVVRASPRPALRHARSSSRLGGLMDGPFDRGVGGPGGWILLDEPELHLGRDRLVPDLAGWRRERLPTLPDTAAIELAPDWVCEVVSPSTEALDRGAKMRIYRRNGVPWLWFVDPVEKCVEVWRLVDGLWREHAIHQGDARCRIEPFDAIEMSLSDLWAV